MSFYGRRKGLMDFDRVEVAGVPQRDGLAQAPQRDQAGADADISLRRRSQPADRLLPLAEQWFDGFPAEVTPCALVSEFPRIANMLALQWRDRQACAAYFGELLVDRRGGRRGFPPAVQRDLERLRDYWFMGARP
jgi:hypothetical protein